MSGNWDVVALVQLGNVIYIGYLIFGHGVYKAIDRSFILKQGRVAFPTTALRRSAAVFGP